LAASWIRLFADLIENGAFTLTRRSLANFRPPDGAYLAASFPNHERDKHSSFWTPELP
jgi:hypothetical protein